MRNVVPTSTFSLFFNSSLSFNHANDPHINHWLKEYGYPAEPHVPTSLSFEAAAMPANSRLLYSVHLSTITNASDLTAFNLGGGVFYALVKLKILCCSSAHRPVITPISLR